MNHDNESPPVLPSGVELLVRFGGSGAEGSQLVHLTDWMAQVEGRLADLHGQVAAVESAAQTLHVRVSNNLELLRERLVDSGQTEADLQHGVWKDEFAKLAHSALARLADRAAERLRLGERDQAVLLSRLCYELFVASAPDIEALRAWFAVNGGDRRFGPVMRQALDLRERVTGAGGWWRFRVGREFDLDAHEPWTTSQTGRSVDFVVIPAYLCGAGSRLSKPVVFCAP